MASFESVNYSVRPNKNVERKLIFEALQALGTTFDYSQYQYVGMGSMWFVDFFFAHKYLKIESLISIEKAEHANRAKFNQPYKNIEVLGGDSSVVLPDINWSKKSIVWMDYDTCLVDGPARDDSNYLIRNLPMGSILAITVNAHSSSIPLEGDGTKTEKRLRGLNSALGSLVPSNLGQNALSLKNYPTTVARMLVDWMRSSAVKSGREEELVPIFQYIYKDNAPMVTVGAMIVNEEYRQKLEEAGSLDDLDHCSGDTPFHIRVPNLTPKEKISLDQALPTQAPFTQEWMQEKFGFSISQENLEAYQKFYKIYPIYSELFQ